ncbi:MAG: hypothetical protein ABUT20_16200 [Bacteroidota bacterium]
MKRVEIFKTNVLRKREANKMLRKMTGHFPAYKINFDLSDCDKILRVEGENIPHGKIIKLLKSENYQCSVLE